MKTTQKLNLSLWCAVFAIMLSIAMLLSLLVTGDKTDPLTFISAIAAFVGISVTMLIGFQIYSVISINDKLKSIDLLKDELILTKGELSTTKTDISLLENELKGTILLSESNIKEGQGNFFEAFEKLQYAIVYFADLDTKKEELDIYVKLLGEYSIKINQNELKRTKNLRIKAFLLFVRDNTFKLRQRKYYWLIKEDYEKIYDDLEQKIHLFESIKN